jgi:5-formyltetrahydrofolate cyclo-ligase
LLGDAAHGDRFGHDDFGSVPWVVTADGSGSTRYLLHRFGAEAPRLPVRFYRVRVPQHHSAPSSGQSPDQSPEPAADRTVSQAADRAKAALRRTALARRRGRSTAAIAAARTAITDHLLAHLAGRPVVAAYLPLATEPLDPDLPGRLESAGCRVLLPLASAGAALDWARHDGHARLGSFGIAEPAGTRLGVGAVADADVVLVPALLVDRRGVRLGRGGGHYDRTLGAAGGELIAVIFDDELVPELPVGPFDVPVGAVVTPGGGVQVLGSE